MQGDGFYITASPTGEDIASVISYDRFAYVNC